jgi:hypothetical protein
MTVEADRDGAPITARTGQPDGPGRASRGLSWWLVAAAILVGGSAAALVTTGANIRNAATARDGASCRLTNVWSADASGRIVRFLSNDEAAAMLQRTEESMGGKISPLYATYRAAVVMDRTVSGQHRVGVRIPTDMDVKVGDDVFFKAGHRDQTLPCNYVPNVVVGPSAAPAP